MGASSSDFNVFVFIVFILLILTLAGLMRDGIEWAIFPGTAVILGIIFTVAFLADGDLTQVSGGSTVVIASASTASTSVWQFLQYVPMLLTVMPGCIAVYKVAKAF